jgi:hypothetical protein
MCCAGNDLAMDQAPNYGVASNTWCVHYFRICSESESASGSNLWQLVASVSQVVRYGSLITCSECGQAQEALLPATPDAHDHHVTLLHTQHSVHSGEVLQSIIKQHQMKPVVQLVILLQNLRHNRMRSLIYQNLLMRESWQFYELGKFPLHRELTWT